jgi:hypothetical protein
MDKAGMRRTGSDDRLHYYEAVAPVGTPAGSS